ncbi:MAG: restriction endonuclease subunit S [Bacteroidales bacterium]|nr:restriction endonuclease subunit S [Bacteroidales bacterium]
MTTKPSYTPALRFPDFLNDGEWRFVHGNELFEPIVNKNHNSELPVLAITQDQGAVPRDMIDYKVIVSEKSVAGYKVVEVGDFIISLRSFQGGIEYSNYKGLCSPAYIILRKKDDGICNDFYRYYFKSSRFIKDLNRNLEGIRDGKMISYQQFSEIMLPLPPLPEQRRIAQALTALDELIAATNEKLEQMKAYKKGLMQKLFPAKGKKLPELRFKEFEQDGEWEEKVLEEVTKVVNRRNKSNRDLPIYSISNKDGFILQSEQFDGLDSVSRGYDTSLYKIVTSNTFAYNPARINVGSIGYSGNIKECLISSLYVCFKTTEDVDDLFLMYFFDTSSFNQSVENNVEGGIRSYLFYENFSRIKIAVPSITEQKKIASTVLSINNLIEDYTKKLSLLEEHKKGLMQQLFPKLNKYNYE